MTSNSSLDNCSFTSLTFQSSLYATTFTIIVIPGFLANSAALWVLCSFIKKKNKAVIFMINLAAADLIHVLSLPLRIYYYINHIWPFGRTLCLLCFYLKYLNMYASIAFLTCISIQRCLFLRTPFRARDWKCRYDVGISASIWIVVGVVCSLFPYLRSSQMKSDGCFADLGMMQMNVAVSAMMITMLELAGFVLPLITILYCTWKTSQFLQNKESLAQYTKQKSKAMNMVITCATVFFICFAPYHINFALYLMVKGNVIAHCALRRSILSFHPFSLCLASLNCCLNPILYYYTTSEFQNQISRHGSTIMRNRLMSKESSSSFRELS